MRRLCGNVHQISLDGPGIGHGHWSGFSCFFLKNQAERRKSVFYFPLTLLQVYAYMSHKLRIYMFRNSTGDGKCLEFYKGHSPLASGVFQAPHCTYSHSVASTKHTMCLSSTTHTNSRRQNKVHIEERLQNDFTATLHGSLTLKSLTNSPMQCLLKRLFSDFSKRLYYTFAYASAAIGIGIPLNACASSAPPHQSTEQLPAGF